MWPTLRRRKPLSDEQPLDIGPVTAIDLPCFWHGGLQERLTVIHVSPSIESRGPTLRSPAEATIHRSEIQNYFLLFFAWIRPVWWRQIIIGRFTADQSLPKPLPQESVTCP